jgi:TolA-binding protein
MGRRSRRRAQSQPDTPEPAAPEPEQTEQAAERAPATEPAQLPEGYRRPDPTGRAGWILLETYRWTVLHGQAPYPEDWEEDPEYPSTREIEELFGSWEDLWEIAGLYDSHYLRQLDAHDEQAKRLDEERRGTRREATRLRREAERLEDRLREMRRQVESAKGKAEEAQGALAAQRVRAERAERRADAAEGALREGSGDSSPPVSAEGVPAQEHERAVAALAEAERHSGALAAQLDEAHEELEAKDREVVTLRQALAALEGEGAGEPEGGPPEEAPPPSTVREAVEQAAARCPHLTFAPRAYESAADSPFSRPQLILENLLRLDELAARYLEGDLGERLSDLAFRLRLNWRGGISERTRTRYGKEYEFTLDARTYELGPHVRIGSGQGAGAIARIYLCLHPGDAERERSVIVGHVGRHLPDSTT